MNMFCNKIFPRVENIINNYNTRSAQVMLNIKLLHKCLMLETQYCSKRYEGPRLIVNPLINLWDQHSLSFPFCYFYYFFGLNTFSLICNPLKHKKIHCNHVQQTNHVASLVVHLGLAGLTPDNTLLLIITRPVHGLGWGGLDLFSAQPKVFGFIKI